MAEVKGKEFVEAFLAHPNPIIYSSCPSVPEVCSAVIPQENGSFNSKSPRMGLGSFLLEAAAVRDVRKLWHSWDETWPRGLWNRTHRENIVDALNKPVTFFFDAPTIDPDQLPQDLMDPRFVHLDVRNVPWLPFLRGPVLEAIFGHDVAMVFSLKVPTLPTKTRLEKLGLVYVSS